MCCITDCCCPSVIAVIAVGLYALWRYCQGGRFDKPHVRLDGKVAIITGSNTGLGRANALDFARRGARVYIAVRNVEAGQRARDDIVAQTGNAQVFVLKLDLSSLQSVRDFVQKFQSLEDRLHLLINNAGVTVDTRQLTADGFEMHFGTNHLGHFLLTTLLLDTLKASAPSRIVNLTSMAHTSAKRLERDNLNSERSFGQLAAYAQSKLSNILFARELTRRLRGTGVVANSVHPGVVKSDFLRNHPIISTLMAPVMALLFKTVEAGVQTQLAVAVDPDLAEVSGRYFSDCRVKVESLAAQDDEDALWLWEHSEKLVASAEKK